MLLTGIFFVLLCWGLVFTLGASIIGIAVALGVVVGALTLAQLLLGAVLRGVTGKRPRWLLSAGSFVVEGLVAAALFAVWYTTPVQPLRIPVENCAYISVSNTGYGPAERDITDPAQIRAMADALEAQTLLRRVNLRFLNEGMVDGTNGTYITFCDEAGGVIRKLRITADYVGVAKKDNSTLTVYTYYRTCEETDLSAVSRVHQEAKDANARARNAAQLAAFAEGMRCENGVLSLYIPQWQAEHWNIRISGRVPNDDGRAWIEYRDVTYGTDRTDESAWPAGETVSLTLENAPHTELTCTLYLDGGCFTWDLLPLLEPPYAAQG